MDPRRTPRPIDSADEGQRGAALLALAAILIVTCAWWALALWPAGVLEPEWLTRTRAACFGVSHDGLPDAGGWVLLIGEPAGMFALLFVLYSRRLKTDLRWLMRRPVLRALSAGGMLGVVTLIGVLGVRVSGLWGAPRDRGVPATALRRVDAEAPGIRLVDQLGRDIRVGAPRRGPALVTFAFGHCTTVCPTVVNELIVARRAAHREDVPLLVVTVDPWRDTPERLPSMAEHWGLGAEDHVLSGDVYDVTAVLDQLGVGRRRNDTTGDVDHGSTAFIVNADGRLEWRVDGGPREIARLVGKL